MYGVGNWGKQLPVWWTDAPFEASWMMVEGRKCKLHDIKHWVGFLEVGCSSQYPCHLHFMSVICDMHHTCYIIHVHEPSHCLHHVHLLQYVMLQDLFVAIQCWSDICRVVPGDPCLKICVGFRVAIIRGHAGSNHLRVWVANDYVEQLLLIDPMQSTCGWSTVCTS